MKIARWLAGAGLLALMFASAGCGDDSAGCGCTNHLPPTMETPQQAMARFELAYEAENPDAYADLFTTDFHYVFSAQSDPVLVSQFGSSWGIARDTSSTRHLFDGFTNGIGDYVPAASTITLTLAGTHYETDPEHADSTRHYVLADSALVNLGIILQADIGEFTSEGYHSFRLVRGDAAHVGEGQSADSTRWYIRRWDDLTSALAARTPGRLAPSSTMPARNTSWGAIKAQYLE